MSQTPSEGGTPMDKTKKLRLERTFDAPVERVWAAWADASSTRSD